MTMLSQNPPQEQWVKILAKGMLTIPKVFRNQLKIRDGEVARVRKVGNRLVIEPREVVDYEVYSKKELEEMLKEDKLPKRLAQLASSFWPDLE